MSSREIAELLGNRHDDVKRSIDRLAKRSAISHPPMADRVFVDALGQRRTEVVYHLDKRSSLIVVAQLSPVKRTIESLVMRAVFDRPQSEEVQIETSHGRRHPVHVYLLDKRSSLIVVAQLSPVKRTIERLADRGTIVRPQSVDEPGSDSMGRPRPTHVYLLDKRSSLIVVAQLSPEFTARVVDRWQELEARVSVPATTT